MTDRGDRLLLQRVTDKAVDLDGISCLRPEGAALQDLVIAEWHRVNGALLGI